jgi:ABC-type nitrate/sulfonate/bicarbonate transport system substrate-binding protein
MKRFVSLCMAALMLLAVGCNGDSGGTKDPETTTTTTKTTTSSTKKLPAFSCATSEYPSWSTLMVAGKLGLINPDAGGKYGKFEQEYGVDVILNVVDYDKCIELYGNGACDATCITNIDVLPIAISRKTTAICPTSTSAGADQCIVNGVSDLDALKQVPIHMLTKSVSEYTVFRCLEKSGKNYREYTVKHLDPSAAATALESNSTDVRAICVWNPFALNTTKKNKNAKVLFSSDAIPGEVVDMMVVGNDTLEKEGGKAFAKCLCRTFYEVNRQLEDKATGDKTLQMLGEDFSDLPLDDMRVIVKETKFYLTPTDGTKLFQSKELKETMATVIRVSKEIEILGTTDDVTISYAAPGDTTVSNQRAGQNVNLTFDSQFMAR